MYGESLCPPCPIPTPSPTPTPDPEQPNSQHCDCPKAEHLSTVPIFPLPLGQHLISRGCDGGRG